MNILIKTKKKKSVQENSREKPRILMLVEKFPPAYSGAGQQAYLLSQTLAKFGYNVKIITQNQESLPSKMIHNGVEILRLKSIRMRRLYSYLFAIKAALWLWRHSNQYDVLHVHGINLWGVPAMLVARLTGKQIVAKMTSMGKDDPSGLDKMSFGKLRRKVYLFPHKIIALSQAMAEQYLKSNFKADKLIKIANGVDLNKYFPVEKNQKIKLRQKLGLPIKKKIVIFVGNICYLKGVGLLIDTWAKYLKNNNSILCLVGPDVMQDSFSKNLRIKIEQEKIKDRIILTGHCNKVAEYMQAADVFVLPSKREGLPNALLEAMACGLPSIVYDIPAVKKIFEQEPPILRVLEEYNPGKLADIILKTLDPNKGRQLGHRAYNFILNEFSIEEIAGKYIKLYSELVEN